MKTLPESQHPTVQTKEVFAASNAKTFIFAKNALSLPSIEQNFYFVQLSVDFKMPSSIGSFIENRRTADQRMRAAHPFERSIAAHRLLCVVFELPAMLTGQSCRLFLYRHTGILKFNSPGAFLRIFAVMNELA